MTLALRSASTMLRAQVLRRSFSLFNRVPYARIAQSAAQQGHESVTIYRVRIRRRLMSRSRAIGTLAIGSALWGLSHYVSVEVEVEDAKEEGQDAVDPSAGGKGTDEKKADREHHEVLFFIPTGFSRPAPKTFYRGSDPEWQEFKKLASDRQRVEKMRDDLTSLLRKMAFNSPAWNNRLGKINLNAGRAWIELKFPDGPPTGYQQPGFAFTDHMEWWKVNRPVTSVQHQRMNRALFPIDVSNALYQDMKRKAVQSWKSLKASVGLGEKLRPENVYDMVQKVIVNTPSTPNAGVSVTPTAPNPAATGVDSPESADPASSASSQVKELGFFLPDPKNHTLDLTTFRQDMKNSFKPYALQITRGSCMVYGLIEIHGDRARITLNVVASYDPKHDRYISVRANIWNSAEHNQRPRGGP